MLSMSVKEEKDLDELVVKYLDELVVKYFYDWTKHTTARLAKASLGGWH